MRKRRFRPLKPFIGDKISQVVGYKISPIREMYYNYADLDEPDVFGVAAEYGDLKQLLIQTLPYIDRNRLTNVNLRVQGKGLTVENAIFSAIGEFLERYALLFPYQESLVFGSYEHLSGKGLIAIDPREIQLFADEQYDLPTFPFKRFTETTEIWWVKGLRLIDAMEVWFPAQLVFHVPLCGDTPIAYATSSGCAAANDLEEAILKGLYELAERDAYMIAWHAKLAQPRIELDDELENLVSERFRSSNVEIRFFYMTLDIDIPVIMGACLNRKNEEPKIAFGSAASLDLKEAIIKAMLEVAQCLSLVKYLMVAKQMPTDLSRIYDLDTTPRYYSHPHNFDKVKFLVSSDSLLPLATSKSTGDVKQDLRIAIQAFAKAKLAPIAFDLTTRDLEQLGVCVARVVTVPSVMPFCLPSLPFLGVRRLYEVPQKVGWTDKVLKYEDLNLLPHPFPCP